MNLKRQIQVPHFSTSTLMTRTIKSKGRTKEGRNDRNPITVHQSLNEIMLVWSHRFKWLILLSLNDNIVHYSVFFTSISTYIYKEHASLHSVEKRGIYYHLKNVPKNKSFDDFLRKKVAFTKF